MQQAVHEAFDPDLLLQMLRHSLFHGSQLVQLVKLVLRAVVEGSICPSVCSKFVAWGHEQHTLLSGLSSFEEVVSTTPRVLLEMLERLKQSRVDELNIKMKLLLPIFKRQGADYERRLVQESLRDGSLQLTKTVGIRTVPQQHDPSHL